MAFQQVSPAVAAAVVILAAVSRAQAVSTLNGTWRGTSICTTVGKPACHDEVVVYYTRLRDSSKPAPIPLRLDWTANKIVGGKEESMGELVCGVQPDRRSVICPMRDWRWRFAVRGDTMTGTLVNANEVVWRNIRAVRDKR
jgi:hypothetical protein